MKRVASRDRETTTSDSEEPHFKKRKVEEGQKAESTFVFFPRELHKQIFFYSVEQEQWYPLALGQVSKSFNYMINSFVQEILEENYTKEDLFPFKARLLPKFQTSSFALPGICYLHALKNLTDPICLSYKMTFEYHLNLYINLWVESGFMFAPANDNSYTFVTRFVATSFDIKNYSSILVLNKIFERYLLSDRFSSDLDFERTTSMLRFISKHNSQEKYLDIIRNLIFHFYQQCLSKDHSYLYLRMLVVLVTEGVINPDRTQNLKNLAIANLVDPSIPLNCQLLSVDLLIELLSQDLKLIPDEINFLKDLAIRNLFDASAPLSDESSLINLLAELLSQDLRLSPDEIKSLKDFAIKKLLDPLTLASFQIDLLCFLNQLLLQDLDLQADEMNSLKNFVITKLDQSIFEQVHSVSLLIQLLSQNLRFQANEIESIKNFAITKISDESCALEEQQWILILLSLIINPEELFDLVPLGFLKEKFLYGIHNHCLKDNLHYDCPSTVKKLTQFYLLWMTHPDEEIQLLANDIHGIVSGCLS